MFHTVKSTREKIKQQKGMGVSKVWVEDHRDLHEKDRSEDMKVIKMPCRKSYDNCQKGQEPGAYQLVWLQNNNKH